MAPPSYSDLGKASKDLFNKGYNFGFLKLDTNTKTGSNVEFKMASSHNIATGKLFGGLDVKYKIPKYGVTLTEKWNTDNNLTTEITVEDQLTKGLKLTLDSAFAPHLGKRTGKIKGDFSHQYVKVNADTTLDSQGPIINAAAVVGYEGWLLGYQTGYDTQRAKITLSNFSIGRKVGNYAVHTFVHTGWPPLQSNDSSEFGGSVYHRVNRNFELGANLGWTSGEQTTRFGLAAKYQAAQDTIFRAKVSNTSQVGVAMTQTLTPELKLTLSGLVNLQNFQEGGHKFGLGIEYDP